MQIIDVSLQSSKPKGILIITILQTSKSHRKPKNTFTENVMNRIIRDELSGYMHNIVRRKDRKDKVSLYLEGMHCCLSFQREGKLFVIRETYSKGKREGIYKNIMKIL